jgi:transcriptional regulator with XRE-family HTH domain
MPRKLGNLERIRSERSLTVEQLSKGSGVPRSTIVGLEGGVRRAQPVTIDKLAEALVHDQTTFSARDRCS